MLWVAYNNGLHDPTGAGYGFKIHPRDLEKYFNLSWKTVTIELPTGHGSFSVEVQLPKWPTKKSPMAITDKEIGRWLIESGFVPWERMHPPIFEVFVAGTRHFRIE